MPFAGARSVFARRSEPWSLASTPSALATVRVVPAVAVAVSGFAIGPTTTVIVAVVDCPEASVTVYVTVSVPEKPGFAVYVIVPSVPSVTSAWDVPVAFVMVRPVPESLPSRVAAGIVSVFVACADAASPFATGVTVTVTVTGAVVLPAASVDRVGEGVRPRGAGGGRVLDGAVGGDRDRRRAGAGRRPWWSGRCRSRSPARR